MNVINDIVYPAYIGTIPKGASKTKEIVDSFVVWGYYSDTTLFVYDAIPQKYYDQKSYDTDYGERIDTVRAICNVNRYLDIVDLPMEKVFTPKELTDYIQQTLFEDNNGVIIFCSCGEYNFKDDKPDSFFEILRDGV